MDGFPGFCATREAYDGGGASDMGTETNDAISSEAGLSEFCTG